MSSCGRDTIITEIVIQNRALSSQKNLYNKPFYNRNFSRLP
jgi:hypothetical protein